MKPEFAPEGISVQTFQGVYDELADGYREIYGQDINLDPDSPDGQRVGIEAQARLDLQSFGAYMYTQFDPDTAMGLALNTIIKYAGITRRPATRSQVDVEITTDRPVTLPSDYAVEDDLGQAWTTRQVVSSTDGTSTVSLFAENFGAVEADAGIVTEPVTVVLGVTSVTNPAAATVGREEETDEELRIRRNNSLIAPATSSRGGIFTAVGNTPNVVGLVVYENDQATTDTERSMAPHSIWAVIEGGSVNDIAEAITKSKTAGTTLKGSVTGIYTEELVKPDGTSFNYIHEVIFDRPTYVDLHVRLTATRKDSGQAIDLDAIKNAIADKTFAIGDSQQSGDLYSYAYQGGNTFILTALEISDDGTAWTDGLLISGYDEKFRLDTANISITEVI
jgi:uncharacterized phage protein gp47/JayE